MIRSPYVAAAIAAPAVNHPRMRDTICSVIAASPSRTAASSPLRGDHNVPVCVMRGRIQIVRESAVDTRPSQRQSETITCVAAISDPRAKLIGTESLTPPSVSRSCSLPQITDIGGKRCGIDALARTVSCSGTRSSIPVPK